MSGRASRNKGASGERELAAILCDALGTVVRRKLGQPRDAGEDIQVGKFRIEVKRCETLALPRWCKQIETACQSDVTDVPVVAYRRNGEVWRVVLRLDDFLPMMREELTQEKDDEFGTDTAS